jgi:hypothetical protein
MKADLDKGKSLGIKAIRRLAVAWAASLLILSLSGCGMIRFLLEPLPPPPTLPSVDIIPSTRVSTSITTTPRVTPATRTAASTATPPPTKPTTATSALATTTRPGDSFEDRVTRLIIQGLDKASREIVLDEALSGRTVYEDDVDDTIEQVFDLFQEIYYTHPQYYFLSGQANAGYVLFRGTSTTLQSVTLKPGFIDSVADLSDSAILERQKTLEAAADAMAAEAKKAGDSKTVQLRYVHDTLIRLIEYDLKAAEESTMNRERSNAASAMLDRLALCRDTRQRFSWSRSGSVWRS